MNVYQDLEKKKTKCVKKYGGTPFDKLSCTKQNAQLNHEKLAIDFTAGFREDETPDSENQTPKAESRRLFLVNYIFSPAILIFMWDFN